MLLTHSLHIADQFHTVLANLFYVLVESVREVLQFLKFAKDGLVRVVRAVRKPVPVWRRINEIFKLVHAHTKNLPRVF